MEPLNLEPLNELARLEARFISRATVPDYLGLNLGLCSGGQSITPTHLLFCSYPRMQIRCSLELGYGQDAISRSELSLECGKPTLFVLDIDDVAVSTRMPKWLRRGQQEWQKRLRCLWILLFNQCSFVTPVFKDAQRLS